MDGAALAVVGLANATGSDFALSADVMTDAMAQFGFKAEELGTVIDGITGVTVNSKFTMEDFALALAQGGGVAAVSGVKFEDFTTTIAAISPLFASGSDAGTSFKTMIVRLAAPTDEAAKKMRELGINAYDAQGNMLGMDEIAGQLNTALAGLTEQQQAAALQTMFGADAMRAAAGIAKFTQEEFAALGEKVNISGSAMESSSTRVDNLKGDLEIFMGIVEAAGITIGQKLLPFLRYFAQLAIDAATVALPFIVGGFDKLTTSIQLANDMMAAGFGFWLTLETVLKTLGLEGLLPVIQYMAELGETIMTYLQPVIDFIAANVQLSDVLMAMGVAVAVFVLPILASLLLSLAGILLPIIAVIAVIALLRTAWENNWGGIQEKTAAVMAFIQAKFAELSAWVTGTLIPTLQTLYDKWVTVVWPAIQEALSNAWIIIVDIFTQFSTWVTGTLIPNLQLLYDKWVTEVWPTIQTVTENVWEVVSKVFAEIGRWINDNIVPWIKFLAKEWSKKWEEIKGKLTEVWAVVEPVFVLIKDWMEKKIQEAVVSFGAKWQEIMSALAGPIESAKGVWDGFVSAVQGFWDWISNKTFSFNISLPDLPSWAIPDSPLPIHTAWENFADDMNRMIIEPTVIMPNALAPELAFDGGGQNWVQNNTTVQLAQGQDPMRALRAARHLDAIGAQ
jgi:TP901 family phage tail tape measure protein